MLSLRTHVIICVALFCALIGIALLGNLLQRAGVAPPSGAARTIAFACYFALFIAFGLSAIPVIVKIVVGAQVELGNQNVPAVAAAIRRQNTIIWWLWGLIGAGMLFAVPAAVAGGLFGDGPQHALRGLMKGRNLGVLAAKPTMTLDEMTAKSTIKLNLRYASAVIAGGQDGVFDYTIPGTTLTFPGARYYYITTFKSDPQRIEAVNVGISPDKMTVAEVDSADAALQARLAADGWLVGREVYRDEEDRRLHGGLTEGSEGRYWLKDSVVLDINRKRMDDEKPGEDPKTAGEWIQYIQLWASESYPSFDRYSFRAPQR